MPLSNFYWSRQLIPSFSRVWFLIRYQEAHRHQKASNKLKVMIGLSQAKVVDRNNLV
jgi:hypothetical protein